MIIPLPRSPFAVAAIYVAGGILAKAVGSLRRIQSRKPQSAEEYIDALQTKLDAAKESQKELEEYVSARKKEA